MKFITYLQKATQFKWEKKNRQYDFGKKQRQVAPESDKKLSPASARKLQMGAGDSFYGGTQPPPASKLIARMKG